MVKYVRVAGMLDGVVVGEGKVSESDGVDGLMLDPAHEMVT